MPHDASTPRARAAGRYRRTAFSSRPTRWATRYFGTPDSHSLRTSST